MSEQIGEQQSTIGDQQPQQAVERLQASLNGPLGGQQSDRFYEAWDKFTFKSPKPKVSGFPALDVDEENVPSHHPRRNTQGITSSEYATTSYDEASAACVSKVDAIVRECRRLNIKYNDMSFRLPEYDTLASLANGENPDSVEGDGQGAFKGSVKRIEDIFERPHFTIDGATANDVRQGSSGDCWFLAAVTALSGTEGPEKDRLHLLEKLFIKQDEKVGVYGFVFFRDGEWISEVVDDRLCLNVSAERAETMDKKMRPIYTKGSDALYFASCRGSNETWLPLLEKAFAKCHGDYQVIEGGISGEGIEDLTGGVNVSIDTEDVLDKEVLWQELKQVNKEFLFGCSSRRGLDSLPADAEGFVRGHAYTVLEAQEWKDWKLLKLKNPWGTQEWNGAWSDGSKEWTADSLRALGHVFGDDGIFWISLRDFLTYYRRMDRTRLFGSDWTVTQQWTTIEVPYNVDYSPTRFRVEVARGGPLVIVLAQPDERYFAGLEGRYIYDLHFRLYKEGVDTYLLRSISGSGCGRSCSAELHVDPGTYIVTMKIKAFRVDNSDERLRREACIKLNRKTRKDKILAIGRSFDSIHSKGLLREAENALVQNTQNEQSKGKKARKIEMMKEERKYNQELKRREKARIKRIDDEVARKVEVKKAAKRVAKKKATAETLPATAGARERPDIDAAGGEAPLTPPDEGGNREEDSFEESSTRAEASNDGFEDEERNTGASSSGAHQGRGRDQTENADAAQNPEDKDDDDTISDVSTARDEDFDWDSDIDDPVDSPIVPVDEDDDIFSSDPWSALCVVGLRVYSRKVPTKISVMKPEK